MDVLAQRAAVLVIGRSWRDCRTIATRATAAARGRHLAGHDLALPNARCRVPRARRSGFPRGGCAQRPRAARRLGRGAWRPQTARRARCIFCTPGSRFPRCNSMGSLRAFFDRLRVFAARRHAFVMGHRVRLSDKSRADARGGVATTVARSLNHGAPASARALGPDSAPHGGSRWVQGTTPAA